MIVISKLSYQFQSFLHHMNQPKSLSVSLIQGIFLMCVFFIQFEVFLKF